MKISNWIKLGIVLVALLLLFPKGVMAEGNPGETTG
jgi:hypothetical protein